MRPASQPLSESELERALADLPGWRVERDALAKTFSFADFRVALAWMVRVGFEAEELDHHPEWTNVFRRVHVRLSTHSAGGRVTALDIELAARMERLTDASPPAPGAKSGGLGKFVNSPRVRRSSSAQG